MNSLQRLGILAPMLLRLLILLSSLLCVGAVSAEPPPRQRVLSADLAWWNAQLLEQYRAVGEHGPWDAAAERFLSLLASHYVGAPPYTTNGDLAPLGMALLEGGCRDPLLILRTAMLYDTSSTSDEYQRSLINWAANLLRQRQGTAKAYGTLHLVAALRRQLKDRDRGISARAHGELPDLVRHAITDGLRDESTRDAGRRRLVYALEILVEPEAVGNDFAATMRALLAEPAIDPWLAQVLLGHAEIRLAWQSRGSGWGEDVTKEGWKGFRKHLGEARRLLTAAWTLRPDLARAPVSMITVAMGDSLDQPLKWAEHAWLADPENADAFTALGTALLPRWGGSHKALLTLAQRAAAGPWDSPLPRAAESLVIAFLDDLRMNWPTKSLPAHVCAQIWPVLDVASAAQPHLPPAVAALRQTRRIAWLWRCERKPEALAAFTAAGGLDAPWLEPGAVPSIFFVGTPERYEQVGATYFALQLQRTVTGASAPALRPLPKDPIPHRDAILVRDLRPDWYARHGTHGAWDAQVAVLFGPMAAHAWGGPIPADPAWPTPAALLASGCSDPLVISQIHSIAPDQDPQRHLQLLDADWQALSDSPYPALAAYQPAWALMNRLAKDPAQRQALQTRYARTVALAAQQAGERAPLAQTLHDLIQLPDQHAGSLTALSEAAAQPGIDPLLAEALRGCVEIRQSLSLAESDPTRRLIAWRAFARLWRVWDATHDPLIAAEMTLAAGISGCTAEEIRSWFDHAVHGAMDLAAPWRNLQAAYALNGRGDLQIATAQEIADLPASAGCHLFALIFLQSVIGNPSQRNPQRMQHIWKIADRVTSSLLETLPPSDRPWLLHQRAAYAFLAGQRTQAQAAVTRLGSDFNPAKLPQGVDRKRFQSELEATATPPVLEDKPVEPPSDF